VGIVLRDPLNPVVPAVNPILSGEGTSHQRAKQRIYDLIKATGPKIIEQEYVYPNPLDPQYDWRFDVYAEFWDGRKIAIEVDGKVGHTSRRAHEKRRVKKLYLKTYGIELYGFPTKWLVSRKPLGDMLFLEELGLLLE
jgi:hypothetical protein